jgi:hypothetical protein
LAPLAVGALLAMFSWREIVMVNLVPGVVIACLILAFLGTWSLVGEAGAKHEAQSLSDYMKGLKALLKSRGPGWRCSWRAPRFAP